MGANVGRWAPMMMVMLLVRGPGVTAARSRVHDRVVIAVGGDGARRVHRRAARRVARFAVQRVSVTGGRFSWRVYWAVYENLYSLNVAQDEKFGIFKRLKTIGLLISLWNI